MDNFKKLGSPGGIRGRKEFMGGRPKSDAQYGAKKSFNKKPGFGGKGGFKGGDRGGFKGGRDGERREVSMHKATCSNCSKPCEVPFRPDGSKPVLCSECFGKNRSDDRNGVERRSDRPKRDFDAPRPLREPSREMVALQQQIASLETTVNEILSLLKTTLVPEEQKVKPVTPKKTVAKKAVKKVAKKAAKKIAKKK
jgi:CxxC-x17-CxxC domain-containing protein